jgi:hypothetical protein
MTIFLKLWMMGTMNVRAAEGRLDAEKAIKLMILKK